MADRDPGGQGLDGAERLSGELVVAGVPCRILLPSEPHKDLRDWLRDGRLTAAGLQEAIADTYIRYPDAGDWPPGFSMTPNAFLRRGLIPRLNAAGKAHGWGERLGTKAFSALAAIASYQGCNGPPRPEQEVLAGLLGTSVRTVQRCLTILREAGLLSWKTGHQDRTNEYDIDFGPCRSGNKRYVQRPRWRPPKKTSPM